MSRDRRRRDRVGATFSGAVALMFCVTIDCAAGQVLVSDKDLSAGIGAMQRAELAQREGKVADAISAWGQMGDKTLVSGYRALGYHYLREKQGLKAAAYFSRAVRGGEIFSAKPLHKLAAANGPAASEAQAFLAQCDNIKERRTPRGNFICAAIAYGANDGKRDALKMAARFLKAGAHGFDLPSMFHYGRAFYFGLGVRRDATQAAYWMKRAARAGHFKAMTFLSTQRGLVSAVEQRYWLQRLSDLGHADSMFYLGQSLRDGTGGAANGQRASHYFQKAIDLGHVSAIRFLAEMYAKGLGVPQNLERAEELYITHSKLEPLDADTAYRLGNIYYRDGAAPNTFGKALNWFTKAAAGRSRLAMTKLGKMYTRGHGTKRDLRQAAVYFEKATKKDEPEGMNGFAEALFYGKGVAQDRNRARQLFKKSGEIALSYAVRAPYYEDMLMQGMKDFHLLARKAVQQKLKGGGCYRGKIDGAFDETTLTCVTTHLVTQRLRKPDPFNRLKDPKVLQRLMKAIEKLTEQRNE